MSLNNTPSAERIHIAFFGRRNAGKSSIMNAVTGQDIAIVSDIRGTTTDPVSKAMELLPIGPVMVIDTPGIDDDGELGKLRIKKSYQVLNKTDTAVVIIDSVIGITETDNMLLEKIKEKGIPFIIVYNKADLSGLEKRSENEISVSAATGANIRELKEMIAGMAVKEENRKTIISHFLGKNDIAVLVVPIDSSAPKGRLILPQQQTIRDILDHNCIAMVTQPEELAKTLCSLSEKPAIVITDSQAFARVNKETPGDIPLTSFSILFANYKGNLKEAVKGAKAIDDLEDGDKVLISEGCTHHRQCGDIGTVKLPAMLEKYTGKKLNYSWTSGTEFPDELEKYSLIIHCGGCMLNEREMKYRLKCAQDEGVPMTNYGTSLAYMNGILKRSLGIFPELSEIINN